MRLYRRPNSPFVWYDVTVNGVRLRGSSKCTTERDARKAVLNLIEEQRQRRGTGDAWRLRELTGAYWQDIGQHRKSEAEIFRYLEFINDIIGSDRLIADLTTADLLDYRARRRTATKRGCSAVTVNRDLATLKAAMYHARDAYSQPIPPIAWKRVMVDENPWRTRYSSAEEFARLLEVAHADLRPMLIMAVTTGLRKSNILGLQWHQVDMDSANITLTRMKSGKPHAVRMTGPLRAALATLQPDPKKRTGKVFDTTGFRRRWEAARKAAGLVDFRFHDLRHTFASWARLNDTDLQALQSALNHSSIAVTMRYSHISAEASNSAFDKVADLLDRQNKPGREAKGKKGEAA